MIWTRLLALIAVSWSAAADEPDRAIAAYCPPLMIDLGEFPGINVEVFREAGKRAGRAYTLEFVPFQRAGKTTRRERNALQVAL